MAIPDPPTYDEKFRPQTRDVATFIKNRTVDYNNNFHPDFLDAGAAVVKADVEGAIDQAGTMVLSALKWDPLAVPPSIPDDNVPTVQSLIALFAAMIIEVTKFSEQITRNVSPYPYLKEMFDSMLAAKQNELGIVSGETGMSMVDLYLQQSKSAFYEFPDNPMVNWDTHF